MADAQQEEQEDVDLGLNDADAWLLSTVQPTEEDQDLIDGNDPRGQMGNHMEGYRGNWIHDDQDNGYGAYDNGGRYHGARYAPYNDGYSPLTTRDVGDTSLATASAGG